MRYLYGQALQEHEAMRRQALARRRIQRARERNERAGQFSLFEDSENGLLSGANPRDLDLQLDQVYTPEPAREPFTLS